MKLRGRSSRDPSLCQSLAARSGSIVDTSVRNYAQTMKEEHRKHRDVY